MDRSTFESLPVGTFVSNIKFGLSGKVIEKDGARLLQMTPCTPESFTSSLANWSDEAIAEATHELPYKVKILWGESPEPDDEPTVYDFATVEELNAFLEGVDQAIKWLSHKQIDPNPDGTWPVTEVEHDEEEEVDTPSGDSKSNDTKK